MLTTTLGAGLALVGVATLIVDMLLLYVLPLRQTYTGTGPGLSSSLTE